MRGAPFFPGVPVPKPMAVTQNYTDRQTQTMKDRYMDRPACCIIDQWFAEHLLIRAVILSH